MVDVVHVTLRYSLYHHPFNEVGEGIAEYVRRQAPRKIIVTTLLGNLDPSDFARHSNADGLIVTLREPAQCASLRRFRRPIVNLLDQRIDCVLPTVCPDDRAVGALAAGHLLACGFKDLCFIGNELPWSVAREEGFAAAAATGGARVATAPELLRREKRLPSSDPTPTTLRRLISRLPARCGVLACNDVLAAQLIELAIGAGRRIPDDLAVIGTDNVVMRCESAYIPLSSIPLDYRRMGMEAMALLDRQIRGERIGKPLILVPPRDVVCRRSTDVVVYADPTVAHAIRFIRAHACEGIDVLEVLRHVVASRRGMDRLFQKHVGHTPADEIRRVRLDTAKRLLLETDLAPIDVAQQSGFCSQSHLTQHFRKAFGHPPHRFRALARLQEEEPREARKKAAAPKASRRFGSIS